MKNVFISMAVLIAVVCFTKHTNAQNSLEVTFYKNASEMTNGKGMHIGKFEKYSTAGDVQNMKVNTKGGIEKVNFSGYWGFSVGDTYFRVDGKTFWCIMQTGQIIYYERGAAHLRLMQSNRGETLAQVQYASDFFAISLSISSPIILLWSNESKKMEKSHPIIGQIKSCYKNSKSMVWYEGVRECVAKYNTINE